jgi:glycosyltransferase involved in cell wall biosynthesis
MERSELTQALLCADAYIAVPGSDSTSLSLLEAFAARLPVIVSELPANEEWVVSGENGYLVRAGDVLQLTQAMLRVAENPEQSRQWGATNRLLVEARGDRESEMRRLEGWYREISEKR